MSTDMLQQQLTHHAIRRMQERDINFDLIRETVRRGWRRDFPPAVLYVSDHITVVTSGTRFITAWRNELKSLWPLIRAAGGADGLTADTAYAFVQDKDKIMFAGVLDISGTRAEIGFGLHRLFASHEESYYDVIVIGLERQAPPRARREKLRLERILDREERRAVVDDVGPVKRQDNDLLSRLADQMSQATTNDHDQRAGYPAISLSIGGRQHNDLAVQRRLHSEQAEHSWVKFGPEVDFLHPYAGFGRLVQLMQETASCLPEVAGRWTYRDARYNDAVYKYTILPLNKLQLGNNTSFHVVCLHSNDHDDEEHSVFRRIGVGRGLLRLDSTGQPSALVLRLMMGKVAQEHGRTIYRPKREIWRGDVRHLQGTTDTELVKDPAPERRADDLAAPDGFEGMIEAFVPLQPGWDEAMQCGEIDRIEQLLREDPSLLHQRLRVDKILNSPRLNDGNGFLVLPIIAAALYRRFDVVDVLLPYYQAAEIELDAFMLTVLSGSATAREQLAERVCQESAHLLVATCPRNVSRRNQRGPHPLSVDSRVDSDDLRFVGCRLIEIAAKLLLTDTVQLLLSLGSAHTPASALQTGDVEQVRRFLTTGEGDFTLNMRFDGRRNAAVANIDSMTPLVYAVYRNDVNMVGMLIKLGADIFVQRAHQESTSINYAQIYDRNVQQGFPVLRLLLEEYRERRSQQRYPNDWVNLRERCERWQHNTHPAAWNLIINYDFENEFENTEVEEAAAGLHEVAVEQGDE
ncbi:hypothetical protein GUITHDRAFT_117522 [Guillardia theta CCMP2712]|uniref:Uncharacterized protein n=1 Tax=Guillardia theta (strain CCMP2712) TaxID=905079 RepID=L1IK66_GUITC|nr:hypothetical protein GUITHDRAFT_117522 [Guillardia theta CCMP2712]EKX36294.1 hypothetical protein GUITHDRAFT_117522 [Guillardia theta CCMP2712]|eukprot:XP_005823274.1 hypothetical protein GUITHDRAFT_117522 [Guillardia theta CCMP2712]